MSKNIINDLCAINVEKTTATGILFQFTFPLEISMPCGQVVTLEKKEDFWRDTPCPCGNFDHWIIRWVEMQG